MSNLIVECEKKVKYLKKASKAIYKILNQKDNLKAELLFVPEDEIKRLNRETRNVDKVTDVLSYPTLDDVRGKVLDKKDFPFDIDEGRIFIGSIAICKKRAEEQALEYGQSTEREIIYLTVHGLLHLMGYDHMVDEDKLQMRTLEKAVMKELGFTED